ncbi:LOW QUALITY PROTEIN: hypothetical protein PHPALM_28790 [Phytophthora palmivora]|uniref:Reverse transcriptase RNase H-like domain-containing protein n=1 Tax=Phytophthora palmivora TaxID=4796 RepID=A0A2P4X964_9STRA|nr:LOW QUALITY PROTEIN: hypothetical protein PHPALM_28790 [Phytophthora palmivora]
MKYVLVKFRVHLLDLRSFGIYSDHRPLRTATNPSHLSYGIHSEYYFCITYKPGKLNTLADALSRLLDHGVFTRIKTDLYDRIRLAYQKDGTFTALVQILF